MTKRRNKRWPHRQRSLGRLTMRQGRLLLARSLDEADPMPMTAPVVAAALGAIMLGAAVNGSVKHPVATPALPPPRKPVPLRGSVLLNEVGKLPDDLDVPEGVTMVSNLGKP